MSTRGEKNIIGMKAVLDLTPPGSNERVNQNNNGLHLGPKLLNLACLLAVTDTSTCTGMKSYYV